MSKTEQIADNQEKNDDIALKYQHLFASANGIKVLADLEEYCGQNKSSVCIQSPDHLQTMFCEGKRAVWLKIDRMLKRKVEKDG